MYDQNYSESLSIDKRSRGLTDRGWRGWENIFPALGFEFSSLCLSSFKLRSEAAATTKEKKKNIVNITKELNNST